MGPDNILGWDPHDILKRNRIPKVISDLLLPEGLLINHHAPSSNCSVSCKVMKVEPRQDGRSSRSGLKAIWDKWLHTWGTLWGIHVFICHPISKLKVGLDLFYSTKKQAVISAGNSGPRKVSGCLEGWHRERTRESQRPRFQSQICTSPALAPPVFMRIINLTMTAGETK